MYIAPAPGPPRKLNGLSNVPRPNKARMAGAAKITKIKVIQGPNLTIASLVLVGRAGAFLPRYKSS